MSNLKLFLIITATFILQVANCQRPMLSLRTFFLTFFPKSCDPQVEKLVNKNTCALGMNNRAIIPCIPKLWLCYIVSKLLFFLTVPTTAGCLSHNIFYFPSLLSYSGNYSFLSLPPSTVPRAVKTNTCTCSISIAVTNC